MYLPGEAMKVRTHPHVGFAYNLNRPLLARYLLEHRLTFAKLSLATPQLAQH